jgi:hypothetical protein
MRLVNFSPIGRRSSEHLANEPGIGIAKPPGEFTLVPVREFVNRGLKSLDAPQDQLGLVHLHNTHIHEGKLYSR